MLRSGLRLSLVSLLISVISFGNQLVLAAFFGSSLHMSAYLVGYSVPAVFTGALTMVFSFSAVPVLMKRRQAGVAYSQVLGAYAVLMTLTAGVVAAIGCLFAGTLIRAVGGSLTPGFIPDAILMCRVFWINAGASMLVALFMAAHNVERRFALPLLSSALPYIGMIATTVVLGGALGSKATSFGMLAGTMAALAWLIATMRERIDVRGLLGEGKDAIGFLREVPLVLLAMLGFCAGSAIEAFWAMKLRPADITYLGYSQRLVVVLASLVAFGPSAVLMTRLSELSARGESSEFRVLAAKALRMSLFTTAPIAVLVGIFAEPIVRLVFQRGAFDNSSTVGVASVLPFAMFGGVALCASVMMMKALFARRQLKQAAYIGVFQVICYFIVSGVLSRALGVQGIVAAFAVSWWITLLGILVFLWKQFWIELWRSVGGFTSALAGELLIVGSLALLGKKTLLSSELQLGRVNLAVRLSTACGVCAIVFTLCALYLFHIPEMAQLAKAFGSRLNAEAAPQLINDAHA